MEHVLWWCWMFKNGKPSQIIDDGLFPPSKVPEYFMIFAGRCPCGDSIVVGFVFGFQRLAHRHSKAVKWIINYSYLCMLSSTRTIPNTINVDKHDHHDLVSSILLVSSNKARVAEVQRYYDVLPGCQYNRLRLWLISFDLLSCGGVILFVPDAVLRNIVTGKPA